MTTKHSGKSSRPTDLRVKSGPGTIDDVFQCGSAVDTNVMERYLAHLETSSKRWEKMVFPAMFAFILLAAYGFFLVYSLSQDMRVIATVVDQDIRNQVNAIGEDINTMSTEVTNMRTKLTEMSDKMDPLQDMTPLLAEITKLDKSVAGIGKSVKGMDGAMQRMDESVYRMGDDVDDMSDSFSGPFGPLGNMMPW